MYLYLKLGLYFLRPLAYADIHAERRRCTVAASVFQRKLRRAYDNNTWVSEIYSVTCVKPVVSIE